MIGRRPERKSICLVLMYPLLVLVVLSSEAYAQSGPAIYDFTDYASYTFNVLKHPTGLILNTVTGPAQIYIADTGNHVIRGFSPGSSVWTLTGSVGQSGYVNGTLAAARFNEPTGMTGKCSRYQIYSPYQPIWVWTCNFYVNDASNYVIRRICYGYGCNGVVSTAAGSNMPGFYDGSSTAARFGFMGGISSWGSYYYCADSENHAIRKWDGTNVTTYAGTGTFGLVNGYRTSAQFNTPTKATWDNAGNMYVVDAGNNVIRKIDTAGNVTTFAGNGTPGFVNGGPTTASFNMPISIAFNSADNFLYVTDSNNNAIRRIDLSGNVTTYAGSWQGGLVNGTLSQARFRSPMDLAIFQGFMYISDRNNNVIRRIDMATGTVMTYIS